MDLVDRLREFINSSGYTSTQFADKAQISRATLSQILSGRNKKISNEIIVKLHEAFPTLDIMWLLFGEGNSMSSRPQTFPRENLLNSIEDTNDSAEEILSGSNSFKHEDKALEYKKITDEEYVSFSNDFFSSGNTHKNIEPKVEKPQAVVKSRRIVAITVFYSDNTYETLQISDAERR